MLYFTDVPGRRREQAVLKTTLKAPHSYTVTTSERRGSVFQDAESAQLPGGQQKLKSLSIS